MKTAKTLASVLLLSAICVSPASANWFSNPRTNTNLNIGSAPNPTPADLRALYSGGYRGTFGRVSSGTTVSPAYVEPVAYVAPHNEFSRTNADFARLEGKSVFGSRGERLGYILTIDHAAKMAEIQTPGGVAVAMSTSLLVDKGDHVMAPTTSKADMMAMAKTQTGRTVAINVTMRNRSFRG